jgi:aspartate/methionine/tyrosine aminotransferase
LGTLLGGSKTESLTGYQIGAVVASAEIIDTIEQVVAFSGPRTSGAAWRCCGRPSRASRLPARW